MGIPLERARTQPAKTFNRRRSLRKAAELAETGKVRAWGLNLTPAGSRLPPYLETNHHRFGFQVHSPHVLHPLLDLIFQGENFGGGGPSAVDDC